MPDRWLNTFLHRYLLGYFDLCFIQVSVIIEESDDQEEENLTDKTSSEDCLDIYEDSEEVNEEHVIQSDDEYDTDIEIEGRFSTYNHEFSIIMSRFS